MDAAGGKGLRQRQSLVLFCFLPLAKSIMFLLCDLPADVLRIVLSSLRPHERHALRRCCALMYDIVPTPGCRLRLSVSNWSAAVPRPVPCGRFWGLRAKTVVLCFNSDSPEIVSAACELCHVLDRAGLSPAVLCVCMSQCRRQPGPRVADLVNAVARQLSWPWARLELRNALANARVDQLADQARVRLSWCDAVLCTASDDSPPPPPFPLLRNLCLGLRDDYRCNVAYQFSPETFPLLEQLDLGPWPSWACAKSVLQTVRAAHQRLHTLASADPGVVSGPPAPFRLRTVQLESAERFVPEALLARTLIVTIKPDVIREILDLGSALRLPNAKHIVLLQQEYCQDYTSCCDAAVAVLRAAPVLVKLTLSFTLALVQDSFVRALPATLRTVRLIGKVDPVPLQRLVDCPLPLRISAAVTGVPRVCSTTEWPLASLADPGPGYPVRRVCVTKTFNPAVPGLGASVGWAERVKDIAIRLPLPTGFGESTAVGLGRMFPGANKISLGGRAEHASDRDLKGLVGLCAAIGPRLKLVRYPWASRARPHEDPDVQRACPWVVGKVV